nr:hypothetical protein [Mycolicibacterium malmesburyense]
MATVGSQDAAVTIIWSETHDSAQFNGNDSILYGSGHYGLSVGGTAYGDWTPLWSVTVYGTQNGTYGCTQNFANAVSYYPTVLSSDYQVSNPRLWLSTFAYTNPSGYAGTAVPAMATDVDGDGLTTAQEWAQGTFDDSTKVDTDGDGISDYNESLWKLNFDETYCDTTTTPHTCTYPNPNRKDLFVEIDWMYDGTTDYKPNSTQISDLVSMYSNHGIVAHFDVGDYGGGKRLPVYSSSLNWNDATNLTNALDMYDFKNGGDSTATGIANYTLLAQFDSHRQNIWRYMVHGVNRISDLPITVGGVADGMGDDTIVASENTNAVTGYQYTKDRALAGLMAHEIGHLLCLTQTHEWVQQDTDCVYQYIDTTNGDNNWKSVMNNNYTLPGLADVSTINYSDGSHGTGDHDDWSAIMEGMGGFIHNGSFTAV